MVKGGLVVDCRLAIYPEILVDVNYTKIFAYVGQTLELVITEIEPVVTCILSHKAIQEKALENQKLKPLKLRKDKLLLEK